MKTISRRCFLKAAASTAALSAAAPIFKNPWLALAAAEMPGYFEREFGITDEACRRILAAALAKGGDYAISISSTPSAIILSSRTARSTRPTAMSHWASASGPSRGNRSATVSHRNSWRSR